MGLLLWTFEMSLCLAVAYAIAARVGWGRGFLERGLVTLCVTPAGVLVVLYGMGSIHGLTRWPVALATSALAGLGAWVAFRGEGRRQIAATFQRDKGIGTRLFADMRREHELLAYVLPIACIAVVLSMFVIWRFPSWSWDCVWYHVPTSNYAVQEHGNGWVETNIHYINGYPRNVELLSAWNTLLLGDTRLDDAAQLPFAILGALAVAAYSRRFSASILSSVAAGCVWLLLPAVCLQIHTTHADIAASALFVTAFYFLTEEPWSRLARWMTFLVFGLYLGCKVTGLFHLALVSPILLWRLWRQPRRTGAKASFWGELGGQLALCLALGAFSYLRNTLLYHNPFWPVRLVVPVFGELTGLIDPHDMAWPPAFFGAPGAFEHMVHQWFTPSGNYYPDVREGPFGVIFAWLLLPSFCVAAVAGLFSKQRWQVLGVVALGVLATLVPVAWWGRYILAMPAAAVIAFMFVHEELRRWPWGRYLRVVLSAIAATLSVSSYAAAVQGYRALPTPFADEATRAKDEDRLREEANWLWPYRFSQLRDATFKAGDVIVYDGGTSFLGEYWTPDLRNRVEFAEDKGDDAAYLQRLRALRPLWVSVAAGSRGEQVLQSNPQIFQPLFAPRRQSEHIYQVLTRDW